MADLTADDGGELVIEELTGDRRRIRMRDRALPSRQSGFRFERVHAVDTQWQQGSPVGTQQPQGAELKPTRISGTWKDRYIDTDSPGVLASAPGTDEVPIATARNVASLFDDVCLKGQTVVVTYLDVTRVGILTMFAWDPKTPYDVDWEAEFEWQSDRVSAGRVSSVVSQDHGARARDVSGNAAQLEEATDFSATSVPLDPDATDGLGSQVDSVMQAAQAAEDAAFGVSDAVNDPVSSALSTAGAFGVVADNAVACAETIQARTYRSWVRVSSLADQASIAVGQVLATVAALWDVLFAARETERAATRHRLELARQAQGESARVVRARQGDDLRSLAQREGLSADDWPELADYNDLPGSELAAGQKVAIPSSRTGARR